VLGAAQHQLVAVLDATSTDRDDGTPTWLARVLVVRPSTVPSPRCRDLGASYSGLLFRTGQMSIATTERAAALSICISGHRSQRGSGNARVTSAIVRFPRTARG
jgi:hypothetical protein